MRSWWALLAALAVVGCPSRGARPVGPAPEYEPPRVMPWDAGRPVDPLGAVQGEDVTDDPPEPIAPAPDAGQEASPDGG